MGVWIETVDEGCCLSLHHDVTPFVGVWIETDLAGDVAEDSPVTPFVGVWIETKLGNTLVTSDSVSHPSWVCGLKLIWMRLRLKVCIVTPFVGVWIETPKMMMTQEIYVVTPFVGVWIETCLPFT